MLEEVLERLGISEVHTGDSSARAKRRAAGEELTSWNPATEEPLGTVATATRDDYEHGVVQSQELFRRWRKTPAPQRGEVIRRLGAALRASKRDLGLLVTLESGKILAEGEGEVQEMIDMCDFAVGLSRQLYGLTMPSERPQHRLFEQWHPLGITGVITAFNFPVAVWAWNAAVAAVCGDPVIWKPSQLTPLTALAVTRIAERVVAGTDFEGLFGLCLTADHSGGEWLAEDRRVPLISATGSCAMGRSVAQKVAARLGRSLLELGGNNSVIVAESANLELALRAVVFAAAGTAGQRCTTLRRLFVHQSIVDTFTSRLTQAYRSIPIGNPWESGILMGPLITADAVARMMVALETAQTQGAEIRYGGRRVDRPGHFVEPTLVSARHDLPIVSQETFAPILYLIPYQDLDEAIAWNNEVPQGLSSAIFTDRLTEMERFLSSQGSDCGIANVNIGTSGAEIGGAFGGEKETGGGREAGSDSWKAYMRRQTCTVNGGTELPLAQGIQFELPFQ